MDRNTTKAAARETGAEASFVEFCKINQLIQSRATIAKIISTALMRFKHERPERFEITLLQRFGCLGNARVLRNNVPRTPISIFT